VSDAIAMIGCDNYFGLASPLATNGKGSQLPLKNENDFYAVTFCASTRTLFERCCE
jgi:hypothetical protein